MKLLHLNYSFEHHEIMRTNCQEYKKGRWALSKTRFQGMETTKFRAKSHAQLLLNNIDGEIQYIFSHSNCTD